jgi:hypothetical protein
MDEYKLYRQQRVPVRPNHLPRFIELVTAVGFVLIVVYLVVR